MNENKIYRPYSLMWGVILMVPFIIWLVLFVLVFGLALKQKITPAVPAIIFSSVAIIMGVRTMSRIISNIHVKISFGSDGVIICNDGTGKSQMIPWETISYAYFCRNYKNLPFLVLSEKEISEKDMKKMKKSSLQKLWSNGMLYMSLFEFDVKDKVQIEKIVNEKVSNVRGFATLLDDD